MMFLTESTDTTKRLEHTGGKAQTTNIFRCVTTEKTAESVEKTALLLFDNQHLLRGENHPSKVIDVVVGLSFIVEVSACKVVEVEAHGVQLKPCQLHFVTFGPH